MTIVPPLRPPLIGTRTDYHSVSVLVHSCHTSPSILRFLNLLIFFPRAISAHCLSRSSFFLLIFIYFHTRVRLHFATLVCLLFSTASWLASSTTISTSTTSTSSPPPFPTPQINLPSLSQRHYTTIPKDTRSNLLPISTSIYKIVYIPKHATLRRQESGAAQARPPRRRRMWKNESVECLYQRILPCTFDHASSLLIHKLHPSPISMLQNPY